MLTSGLVPSASDDVWNQAFHGAYCYSLWNILNSGKISPSSNAALGHELNSLGQAAYVSPVLATAIPAECVWR